MASSESLKNVRITNSTFYWKGDADDCNCDSKKIEMWMKSLNEIATETSKKIKGPQNKPNGDYLLASETNVREVISEASNLLGRKDIQDHLSISDDRVNCKGNPTLLCIKEICEHVVKGVEIDGNNYSYQEGTVQKAQKLLSKLY